MTTLGSLIALAAALTIIICPVIAGAGEHALGKSGLEDAEPAAADYPSYDFRPQQVRVLAFMKWYFFIVIDLKVKLAVVFDSSDLSFL